MALHQSETYYIEQSKRLLESLTDDGAIGTMYRGIYNEYIRRYGPLLLNENVKKMLIEEGSIMRPILTSSYISSSSALTLSSGASP